LINNIIITKNKYDNDYIIKKNKIKKNKGFYKILVEIIKNLNGGNI